MAVPRTHSFVQVDVFATSPYSGNPVAVVLDGTDLSEGQMQQLARWTNPSETMFVLPPTVPVADYRLRIFTPGGELPLAGHPRSAPHVPGWTAAAPRSTPSTSCRSAPPAWSRCAAARTPCPSPPRHGSATAPWTEPESPRQGLRRSAAAHGDRLIHLGLRCSAAQLLVAPRHDRGPGRPSGCAGDRAPGCRVPTAASAATVGDGSSRSGCARGGESTNQD